MTKKSNEDSIHPSETAYDKAIKRMEEREAHIFNTPAMQMVANAAEQIRIQQEPLIQALQPLQDAVQPYHDLRQHRIIIAYKQKAPNAKAECVEKHSIFIARVH